MCKLYSTEAAVSATRIATQVFGGNGFTVEFDIQLFFRRAKSLQINNWNDRYLNELIAADVLA